MPKREPQETAPSPEPQPEQLPAAGGRYERLPDGTLRRMPQPEPAPTTPRGE